jgi:hypothetical protein
MSSYSSAKARKVAVDLLSGETERDQQRKVGASNMSNPCTFCLARDMAVMLDSDIEPAPRGKYFMGSVIGTAIHNLLEERAKDNPDYLPEIRVELGEIPGYGVIKSTSDLYIISKAAVNDWKGLALDTPLPTPTGWTTMRKVQVNDEVLGANGLPTKVLGKSEIKNIRTFTLTFKGGERVVADEEHLWSVAVGKMGTYKTQVMNTLELMGVLKDATVKIRNTQALDSPDAALPIDPYVLGVWLGDGAKDSATVHNPDNRVFDAVTERGYEVGQPFNIKNEGACQARTVKGLYAQLREQGLLNNKHIPVQYLRASKRQRMALLQGLMDTDGYYNHARGGRVSMQTTAQWQAEAVYDLVCSLGWTCQFNPIKVGWQNGSKGGYSVEFTPQEPVFKARTENLGFKTSERSLYRYLISVTEVYNTPTQCIMVDAEDSLYLCTRGYIPTHNTTTREKLKWLRMVPDSEPSEYEFDGLTQARYKVKTYLTQGQLYGMGMEKAGYKVKTVSLIFIARDAKTTEDIWAYTVDYNRKAAEVAFDRAKKIWQALSTGKELETFKSNPLCYTCSVERRV